MRSHIIVGLLATVSMAPASALEIGPTDVNGTVCCLAEAGNNAAYYGQLFVAPGQGGSAKPTSLTFSITSLSGYRGTFRVLVTGIAGDLTQPTTGGGTILFHPTQVLWESQDLAPGLGPITLPIRKLRLNAGETYALILDAFVGFDGSANYIGFSGGPSNYADGYFFFLPNPVGSSRLENFGRTWLGFADPGIDLDFRMTFDSKAKGRTR